MAVDVIVGALHTYMVAATRTVAACFCFPAVAAQEVPVFIGRYTNHTVATIVNTVHSKIMSEEKL